MYLYIMKIKLLLLKIVVCFATFSANSQPVSIRQVVNATGGTISSGSIIIEYNVGEVAVTTHSSGSLTLTQGLLQPDTQVTTSVSRLNPQRYPAHVYVTYPSGAIIVDDESGRLKSYEVINSIGQVFQQGNLNNGRIHVSLRVGVYYLRLYDYSGTPVQVSPIVVY